MSLLTRSMVQDRNSFLHSALVLSTGLRMLVTADIILSFLKYFSSSTIAIFCQMNCMRS